MSAWQQMGRCNSCEHIIQKEVKWLHNFFVPVCPKCGAYNNDDLFETITARRVTRWFKTTIEVLGDDE